MKTKTTYLQNIIKKVRLRWGVSIHKNSQKNIINKNVNNNNKNVNNNNKNVNNNNKNNN